MHVLLLVDECTNHREVCKKESGRQEADGVRWLCISVISEFFALALPTYRWLTSCRSYTSSSHVLCHFCCTTRCSCINSTDALLCKSSVKSS
jgi:hypothetical protein